MAVVKYRPQRGGLAEAMSEVREFDGTVAQLNLLIHPFIVSAVKPYGFDARIGWDTYLVLATHPDWPAEVYPVGYTDGPVE